MIGPKAVQQTAAEETRAYALATERDGSRCQVASWDCAGAVQRDHRKNRSQGGLTVASNLQCLCAAHHLQKTDNPLWANANGFGVPGWAVPSEFPARRWLGTRMGTHRAAWVLYDNAGGWVEISHEHAIKLGKGLIPDAA